MPVYVWRTKKAGRMWNDCGREGRGRRADVSHHNLGVTLKERLWWTQTVGITRALFPAHFPAQLGMHVALRMSCVPALG